MKTHLYILILSIVLFACKKDNANAGSTVAIYLLETFQSVGNKCQVDPAASTIRDTALINNDDIIQYSPASCQFTVSAAAVQKVRVLPDATPFAVMVDQQVVYYGFFKPIFSSASCDHSITMNADFIATNNITMKLGYPGQIEGVAIEDQRNHPTLIATLDKQGKLR